MEEGRRGPIISRCLGGTARALTCEIPVVVSKKPLHTSAYPLAQTHTHTHTARERTDTRTLTHSHVHIATGNQNKSYTEGWVEFADKKVAKVRFMLQSYVSRLPRREGQPVEVAVSKRERTQDAHIHALFAHRPWQDLAITRTCAQAHTPLSPPPPRTPGPDTRVACTENIRDYSFYSY